MELLLAEELKAVVVEGNAQKQPQEASTGPWKECKLVSPEMLSEKLFKSGTTHKLCFSKFFRSVVFNYRFHRLLPDHRGEMLKSTDQLVYPWLSLPVCVLLYRMSAVLRGVRLVEEQSFR